MGLHIRHWAEELQQGDRVFATIRHKTDGSKNMINLAAIVIENNLDNTVLIFANHQEYIVPYNELKQAL